MTSRGDLPTPEALTAALHASWPEEAPLFAAAADLGLVFAPADFTPRTPTRERTFSVACVHPTGTGFNPVGTAGKARQWVDHVRAAGWRVWHPADRPTVDYPTGVLPLVVVAGGLLAGPLWTAPWVYRSLLPAGGPRVAYAPGARRTARRQRELRRAGHGGGAGDVDGPGPERPMGAGAGLDPVTAHPVTPRAPTTPPWSWPGLHWIRDRELSADMGVHARGLYCYDGPDWAMRDALRVEMGDGGFIATARREPPLVAPVFRRLPAVGVRCNLLDGPWERLSLAGAPPSRAMWVDVAAPWIAPCLAAAEPIAPSRAARLEPHTAAIRADAGLRRALTDAVAAIGATDPWVWVDIALAHLEPRA